MYDYINLYPQFQNDRQIRVISHNKKVKEIKKLVQEQESKGDIQVEMIMKALKPIGELTKKQIRKLRR